MIKKEFLLELRQKYALGAILLYVISTVYVCYLTFENISSPAAWNALFWIIMLFAATNAIAKSFVQESEETQLYLYTLTNPRAVILAKTIYNILLMLFIGALCYTAFTLLLPIPVSTNSINYPLLWVSVLLGSIGFSSILTFISAIASKTNNNATLLAILSFPILLPFIISLIDTTSASIMGLTFDYVSKHIITLCSLNVAVIALAYLLFPYLWRD